MKALTNEQIVEIHQLFGQDNVSKASLARQFGVSPRTITRALSLNVENFVKDIEIENEPVPEPVYHFIVTSDSIQITKDGADTSTFLKSTNEEQYSKYVQHIVDGNVDYVYNEITPHEFLNEVLVGMFTVDPRRGQIIYHYQEGIDYPLHGSLAKRMIELVKSGEDVTSISSFAERLMNNPTPSAVEGLYDFLVASNIDIDDDGYVVAYKKVRSNFKDCFSGKFDNSPGQIVSMPRHMVVEDRNELCSAGLHVCSASYLSRYSGQKIVKVKVDPADFVSVPHDYYDGVKAKARVCKYEVVADATEKMKNFI